MNGRVHDIVILGSGAAGWTAAIYAARALRSPLVLRGPEPGGQLTITTDVENYPGFAHTIQGPWLMEQMEAQARGAGTEVIDDEAKAVDFSSAPLTITGSGGAVYRAGAVIIATGAQAKWLGLAGEEKYKGFGVSACATCDGFFYKDKEVLVVGGGNTAAEEALFLTKFARRVRLVHRRGTLRAEKVLQNRVLANPKIEILWNHIIADVSGEESRTGKMTMRKMTGALIRDVKTGGEQKLAADGLFVAIGHEPQTAILKNHLALNQDGTIALRTGSTASSVKGVFAAGDVADSVYRQAVTAAGMGCMAALDAEKYLTESEKTA